MNKPDKYDVGAILHGSSATFRVWAPFAKGMGVSGSFNNWTPAVMQSENDGYWSAKIDNVQAGQEYKYVIESTSGTLHKNDPRALQVTTSSGNSVLVDTEFDWSDDNFTPPPRTQQVIYELHIGTFNRPDRSESGAFQTAAAKLDYLSQLGINMVELMPICAMSGDRGWGYAPDYIYAVESLYGGRHQFLEFVKAAHQKGIGVILDVVYNHFGPDEHLDLWQFDGWSEDGHGGIYFYNDWRAETPWGATRPDFGRLEVRQYITDNVRMWMRDCHVDGLRVDSTIYIRNVKGHNNEPSSDIADGWSMLQDINSASKEVKPESITIAEDTSGNDYITKPESEGGAAFDAQWEIDFPAALRAVLDTTQDEQRNLTGLCDILKHSYNNEAFERIIYSDSHDSAANGHARLAEEISPGNAESIFARKRALLAATIVLTSAGVPMLFAGQEFMQSGSFNDWQALDWKNTEKFRGILQAHKDLIALRQNQKGHAKGLTGQSINILHLNDQSKVLAYHRWRDGGSGDDVVVIINFSSRTLSDYVLNFPVQGTWKIRFNSGWRGYSDDFTDISTSDVIVESSSGQVNLASYSALILSQEN